MHFPSTVLKYLLCLWKGRCVHINDFSFFLISRKADTAASARLLLLESDLHDRQCRMVPVRMTLQSFTQHGLSLHLSIFQKILLFHGETHTAFPIQGNQSSPHRSPDVLKSYWKCGFCSVSSLRSSSFLRFTPCFTYTNKVALPRQLLQYSLPPPTVHKHF